MTAALVDVELTAQPPHRAVTVVSSRLPRAHVVVALVFGVVYVLLGAWTISRSGFMIGDAAYRVANARVILFSRDPHLAAIGMTWMPLSTLATLPFTAVLEPLGLAWLAGTCMSGAFGAGTLVMLARIAHHMDTSPLVTVLTLGVYALNPVTIFWMGSGMMEAPTYFFLSWALLNWLRWLERREVTMLCAVGVALACGVLTRYEQVLVTLVFAVLVLVADRAGQRGRSLVMVVLPTAVAVVTWLAITFTLTGGSSGYLSSPVSGSQCNVANAPLPISLRDAAAGVTSWCDLDVSLMGGVRYAAQRVLLFAPLIVLLAPLMLVRDLRSSGRRSAVLAVLGSTLAVPALVAFMLSNEQGTGNPRYFMAVTIAAPVLALISSRWSHGRLWAALGCLAMAAGAVTSIRMETSERYAGMESEHLPISRLIGVGPDPAAAPSSGTVEAWRAAAATVDRMTNPGDLVALDSSTSFPVLLFSHHLDRFAISEDRDFEQQLSLARTNFDYILVSGGDGSRSATGVEVRLSDLVRSTTEQTFERVAVLPGVGDLYRRVDRP